MAMNMPTNPLSYYPSTMPANNYQSDQLYLYSPLIIFSVILACICALIIIILISIMFYNLCAYGTCCCPTFGSFCCAFDCQSGCCCCCPDPTIRKRQRIIFNNDDNDDNCVRVRRTSRVVTMEEPEESLSRCGSVRGSVRGSIRSVRCKEGPIYIQRSRRPSYAEAPRIIQTYSVRPAPAPVAALPPPIVTQDIYRPGPSITSGSNMRYAPQMNYAPQVNYAPSVMSGFGMVGGNGGGGDLRVVVRNYPTQSSSSQIIHASCPPSGNQMSNDQYVVTGLGNQGQGYSNNGYMGGGGGGCMSDGFSQDGGQHSAIIDVALTNNQSYQPSSANARIVELNDDRASYPTLPQYYD